MARTYRSIRTWVGVYRGDLYTTSEDYDFLRKNGIEVHSVRVVLKGQRDRKNTYNPPKVWRQIQQGKLRAQEKNALRNGKDLPAFVRTKSWWN